MYILQKSSHSNISILSTVYFSIILCRQINKSLITHFKMCQLKPPSVNLNDNTLISQHFICTTCNFNDNHVDIIYLVIFCASNNKILHWRSFISSDCSEFCWTFLRLHLHTFERYELQVYILCRYYCCIHNSHWFHIKSKQSNECIFPHLLYLVSSTDFFLKCKKY